VSTAPDGVEQASAATGPGGSPRTAPRGLRLSGIVALCVCIFFVVFGGITAWKSLYSLPRTYDRLRSNGVDATARFVTCGHPGCTLRLTFDGRTREWRYGLDRAQFSGLAPGAPVQMLVDPNDHSTVYTVHDVRNNTNAGWTGPAIYGVVLFVLGLLGLYGLWRAFKAVRRTYGKPRAA
jgi:hypothetical protein